LTPPGDSNTYVNPNDSTDHAVSIGDWVQGSTGVMNSNAVRNELEVLKTVDIIVPVWDQVNGLNGSNANYHVVNFAKVRITSYDLASGQNKGNVIAANFLGYTTCGQ